MNRKRKRIRTRAFVPRLSAEQRLEWLEGMRALMFEVWKRNPALRARYIKYRRTVW